MMIIDGILHKTYFRASIFNIKKKLNKIQFLSNSHTE